jgi:hypothetical protein
VELYTGPLGDMPRIGDLPRIGELPQINSIGAQYGMPGAWDTPSSFGIGGPGEARTLFPGLIERERLDFGHGSYGPHINKDVYSIFQDGYLGTGSLKPLNLYDDNHIKPW